MCIYININLLRPCIISTWGAMPFTAKINKSNIIRQYNQIIQSLNSNIKVIKQNVGVHNKQCNKTNLKHN